MSDTFDRAFALVIGVEGGYTSNPLDPGNWTGGRQNAGECKGTNYGISAASYPSLDIKGLTLDAAKAIYQRDYWSAVRADELPIEAAVVLFDCAVNSGPAAAVRWAQAASGVSVDGVIGPATMAATQRMTGAKLAAEVTARRIMAVAALTTWRTFGLGWSRRMSGILAAAIAMGAPPPANETVHISPMPPLDAVKQAVREVLDERKAAA